MKQKWVFAIAVFICWGTISSLTAQVKTLGGLVPYNSADTYPTHYDSLGSGGYMIFQTASNRNDLPVDRRKNRMLVFVTDDDAFYQLRAPDNTAASLADDNNWKPVLPPQPVMLYGHYKQPYSEAILADHYMDIVIPIQILGSAYEKVVGNRLFYKNVTFHVGPDVSLHDRDTFLSTTTPSRIADTIINPTSTVVTPQGGTATTTVKVYVYNNTYADAATTNKTATNMPALITPGMDLRLNFLWARYYRRRYENNDYSFLEGPSYVGKVDPTRPGVFLWVHLRLRNENTSGTIPFNEDKLIIVRGLWYPNWFHTIIPDRGITITPQQSP